jgi:1,4-alpha-glucan branching enzyme
VTTAIITQTTAIITHVTKLAKQSVRRFTRPRATIATIELAIFAPYNHDVAVIGSWNSWRPAPMTRDERGWWRAAVPLADGDYAYKFRMKSNSYFARGQSVTVADPRALRWSPDANANACLIVRGGRRVDVSYVWRHDDVPLPLNDALVLYELHVGDFSGGQGDFGGGHPRHTFAAVVEKLDYLAGLGVNAVELMPVNQFPGLYSWGYNPLSLFAVANAYGTPDDLCRLVDECHARGMRVFIDGVYNHADRDAPLAYMDYAYWFHEVNPDARELQFGPKYDYGHRDDNLGIFPAREYVRDAVLTWIDLFHLDGIRFDATAVLGSYEFLSWLHAEIYAHAPGKPFYTIAEHVPQDPSVAGPDGPLDAAWHESLRQQLTATLLGTEFEGRQPFDLAALAGTLDPRAEGFAAAINVVNYLENHDQHRTMTRLGEVARTFGEAAFRRAKLGMALLLTAPGDPMLWMGQEFGNAAPRSSEPQPLAWALLQNESNADLRRYTTGLVKLRTSAAPLHANTFEVVLADAERGLFAFKRWEEASGVVVVVANLRDDFAGAVEVPGWPGDGRWHEFIHNYDVEVEGGVLHDTLAESEVKIYLNWGQA